MKRLPILNTLLLFFVISFSSCEKVETGRNIPRCIEKKIKKEASHCLCFVVEYIYIPKGTHKIHNRIYKFDYEGPACMSQIPIPPTYYDEQCNPVDVVVIDDMGIYYSYIRHNNSVYSINRYVYQYYEKK